MRQRQSLTRPLVCHKVHVCSAVHRSTLHTRTNMLPSTDRTWRKSVTTAAAHDRTKCLTLKWLHTFERGIHEQSIAQHHTRFSTRDRSTACDASHAMHRM